VNELFSLIDHSQSYPALPAGYPFTGVQSAYYWSGTTWVGNTTIAWAVKLNSGAANGEDKTFSYCVWLRSAACLRATHRQACASKTWRELIKKVWEVDLSWLVYHPLISIHLIFTGSYWPCAHKMCVN